MLLTELKKQPAFIEAFQVQLSSFESLAASFDNTYSKCSKINKNELNEKMTMVPC